jgi:hypothetical protein
LSFFGLVPDPKAPFAAVAEEEVKGLGTAPPVLVTILLSLTPKAQHPRLGGLDFQLKGRQSPRQLVPKPYTQRTR